MLDNLLKHIQLLSNSRISYSTAMEVFAECFHSVYGDSSFLSLEPCENGGAGHVRLIFRADAVLSQQFENHINDDIRIDVPQIRQILQSDKPSIIHEVSQELALALESNRLPSQSLMAIPLYLDGEIRRWVLITGFTPEQFDNVDLEQAILIANLASTYMIRIEETQKLEKANAWIEKELDDIGRIQKLLLPQGEVKLKGADVAAYFSSCVQAGGDYFDIVNLSSLMDMEQGDTKADMWGVIIADASGHGAAAAVEIAMFDALLRTYKGSVEEGPAAVFNYTNHYFFTRSSRGSFITASIVSYNPYTHKLICANAGHPPAILLTPEKEVVLLDKDKGIPVGVDPDWQWQNVEYDVKPGSVLICYTDGILEAVSPLQEQFGIDRLTKVITECQGSAGDCLDAIIKAVLYHQEQLEQVDDQAVVVIKIVGDS